MDNGSESFAIGGGSMSSGIYPVLTIELLNAFILRKYLLFNKVSS